MGTVIQILLSTFSSYVLWTFLLFGMWLKTCKQRRVIAIPLAVKMFRIAKFLYWPGAAASVIYDGTIFQPPWATIVMAGDIIFAYLWWQWFKDMDDEDWWKRLRDKALASGRLVAEGG